MVISDSEVALLKKIEFEVPDYMLTLPEKELKKYSLFIGSQVQ